MESFKKISAFFFAALFVLTAVPALIAFNFDRRAFTAETYQRAFAKQDFYNKIPTVLAQTMATMSTDQTQLPIVVRGMDASAWEVFFRNLLPQETLKVMGDDTLSSIFAYLNMQTNSAQISLVPLKASMVNDTGVQAAFTILNTQPECTLDQVFQMTINLFATGELQFCKPPAQLYPMLTPMIQGQMQMAALAVPDQVIIITAPPENDPRMHLQTIRRVMRFSPFVPLGFLVLMTIFAVNSLKSWLNWWGISFFITGAITGLMGLAGAPIFGAIFHRVLVARMPIYLPAILLDFASDLASAMIQALLNPVLWQGLAIFLFGSAMIVGAFATTAVKKMV